jgi:hypothetical protein
MNTNSLFVWIAGGAMLTAIMLPVGFAEHFRRQRRFSLRELFALLTGEAIAISAAIQAVSCIEWHD